MRRQPDWKVWRYHSSACKIPHGVGNIKELTVTPRGSQISHVYAWGRGDTRRSKPGSGAWTTSLSGRHPLPDATTTRCSPQQPFTKKLHFKVRLLLLFCHMYICSTMIIGHTLFRAVWDTSPLSPSPSPMQQSVEIPAKPRLWSCLAMISAPHALNHCPCPIDLVYSYLRSTDSMPGKLAGKL